MYCYYNRRPILCGNNIVFFFFVFLLQKLAVDVGCGTGQSTRILSPFFRRVLGLDVSQAQIENARKESVDNVEFQ